MGVREAHGDPSNVLLSRARVAEQTVLPPPGWRGDGPGAGLLGFPALAGAARQPAGAACREVGEPRHLLRGACRVNFQGVVLRARLVPLLLPLLVRPARPAPFLHLSRSHGSPGGGIDRFRAMARSGKKRACYRERVGGDAQTTRLRARSGDLGRPNGGAGSRIGPGNPRCRNLLTRRRIGGRFPGACVRLP